MIRQVQTSIDTKLDVFGVALLRGTLQNVLLSYFQHWRPPFWYELFLVHFMALIPLGVPNRYHASQPYGG